MYGPLVFPDLTLGQSDATGIQAVCIQPETRMALQGHVISRHEWRASSAPLLCSSLPFCATTEILQGSDWLRELLQQAAAARGDVSSDSAERVLKEACISTDQHSISTYQHALAKTRPRSTGPITWEVGSSVPSGPSPRLVLAQPGSLSLRPAAICQYAG